MKTKHIIVDFDNTLANSYDAICKIYTEDYKNHPNFVEPKWRETKEWNMSDQCPLLYEDGREVLEYFDDPRFFEYMSLFSYAVTIMDNWHILGYKITICTAGTPTNISNKMIPISIIFPYANIVPIFMVNSNGIGKEIVNMEDAIFIDDHRHNLINSNAKHKILYQDEELTNKKKWNGLQANNWDELNKLVVSL